MAREFPSVGEKPLEWSPAAKRALLEFPERVIDEIGEALSAAQFGRKHPNMKPWKGSGPGVFEVVEDFDQNTFRAIYTVRFEQAVYVLHCFQKKSPSGTRTRKQDVDLVASRFRWAREDYEVRYGPGKA